MNGYKMVYKVFLIRIVKKVVFSLYDFKKRFY